MKLTTRVKSLVLALVAAIGLTVNTLTPAEAVTPHAVVAQGQFEGRSDHVVLGSATILKTDSGHVLVLEADFSLDGAPAPTLGFGKGGKFAADTEFSLLQSKDGFQAYAIPASIDLANYDEVYVWCADFSVPLGVAKLK